MWDKRYSAETYIYGKKPNDFLEENVTILKRGKVLCIGEGEGRNAVFLAKNGFEVTALDSSAVGLEKAERLAEENSVQIAIIQADLNHYVFEKNTWDNIVSIFCHLTPKLREAVHRDAQHSLKTNGIFLLEAYTPQQLEFGTGGPPHAELMMTLEMLTKDLSASKLLQGVEKLREVNEGSHHTGMAAVVQVIARKI